MNYEDYPLTSNPEDPEFDSKLRKGVVSRKRSKALPDSYTRPHNGPYNQGSLGSCVGFATKVALEDYFRSEELSALWLYKKAQDFDRTPGNNYSGTTLSAACKAAKKVGAALESLAPYKINNSPAFSEQAKEDASNRRPVAYYTVSIKDRGAIKKLLTESTLKLSIHVHKAFYKVNKQGFIQNEADYLKSKRTGGHAMAVIGYKRVGTKDYLTILNSWGKGFGEDGKVHLSFDLLEKICKGVYVYTDSEDEIPKKNKLMTWLEFIKNSFIYFIKSIIPAIWNRS